VHALWGPVLGGERVGSVTDAPELLLVRREKHRLRDAVGRHQTQGGGHPVVISQCN